MSKKKTCSVFHCTKPHYAKTYCEAHYSKFKRYGTPTPSSSDPPKGRSGKRYRVLFDPTYCFPLHGRFSQFQVTESLERGQWPVGLCFKDVWNNKAYRVQQHLKLIGPMRDAMNTIKAYRTAAGTDPEAGSLRQEFMGWSHDQLVEEIIRLAKKAGE